MEKDNDKITSAQGIDTPNTVIVIGRLFGSGGRRIGKLVAEKLGIAYFDKELLAHAAGSLDYTQDIFAAHDERKPSPLRSLLQGVFGIADNFHDVSLSGESLYRAQCDVIRKICESQSCVIVGRTADHIMRHHEGLVSVFLHSPIEARTRSIIERGDASDPDEAASLARKNDREREGYYNYYTGRHWGRASNYHLTLDSSSMSDDDVASIIVEFAKRRITHNKR